MSCPTFEEMRKITGGCHTYVTLTAQHVAQLIDQDFLPGEKEDIKELALEQLRRRASEIRGELRVARGEEEQRPHTALAPRPFLLHP